MVACRPLSTGRLCAAFTAALTLLVGLIAFGTVPPVALDANGAAQAISDRAMSAAYAARSKSRRHFGLFTASTQRATGAQSARISAHRVTSPSHVSLIAVASLLTVTGRIAGT